MPRIPNLFKRKHWSDYKRYTKPSKRDNVIHNLVYNTKRWKLLRLEKLRNQPLCERCLMNNKITSAIDVHHILPISNGKDDFDKAKLGFDYNNLMSVCKDCHKLIHK